VTPLSGMLALVEEMAEELLLQIAVPRLEGGGSGDRMIAALLAVASALGLRPLVEGWKKHLAHAQGKASSG